MTRPVLCPPSPEEGGAAFPVLNKSYGMTLRDWFAGMALAGMRAKTNVNSGPNDYARFAYQQADAMLAEREKPPRQD